MSQRSHWERVYRTKAPSELSWFQLEARPSLELIRLAAPAPGARIIDIGGGASPLVDGLLAAGYNDITVVDISPRALAHARARLGATADGVRWIEADILTDALPAETFDVWHDRAVFHFLTSGPDRERYRDRMRRSVRPGGHAIVATFADDGPARCSGLPVERYSPEALAACFAPAFELGSSARQEHITPAGARQPFTYCLLRRTAKTGSA
jgi:SAM-dependent methyltransferase